MEETHNARNQILTAAGELFARKGYHATSIREIAQASGILSGSLYAHIRSKEDLLFDIVYDIATAFTSGIKPVVESNLAPHEKLYEGLRFHIRTVAAHLSMVTVYYNDWIMLSDVRRTRIKSLREQYEEQWTIIVRDCIEPNAYQHADENAVTLVILSSAHWVYQWYRPSGEVTADDIADRFYEVIVGGVNHPLNTDMTRRVGG